jgi:hypothetical protein
VAPTITLGSKRSELSASLPTGRADTAHRNARHDAESAAACASDDIPNYKTHNGKFMWKLLTARIAMLFGR